MPDLDQTVELPSAVLFCCDHNKIRSPMAEGIMKKFYGTAVYVQSAGAISGLETDGFAVVVCSEIGVDLGRHRPRSFYEMEDWGDDFSGFDLIVALSPASQRRTLELTRFYHLDVEYWPIMDPIGLGDTRNDKLNAFRSTRDQIIRRMQDRFGPPLVEDSESLLGSESEVDQDHNVLVDEVHSRLDELERFIEPIVSAHSMIGHNNPPYDQRIDEPFTRSDWLDMQDALDEIRGGVAKTEVSEVNLKAPIEVLEAKNGKLSKWITTRATKMVDSTLVAVGTALGASIVIDPDKLLQLSKNLISSLQSLFASVPLP